MRIILTHQVVLCFYSEDKATDFDDVVNINDFKSFKYKAKLLRNTEVNGVNGILRNPAIAVPLKYLINFWRSLEMPLIDCKVELELKWTNNCEVVMIHLQIKMIMIMLILPIFFLPSKTQNYCSCSQIICKRQLRTINFLAKGLKDQ